MKNLAKLRRNVGLSQQALADQFHLSQQTIYKYENSLAQPDIQIMIEMASFFGVSVDYLIGNDNHRLTEDTDCVAEFTVAEKDMMLKIRKIKPGVRSALDVFIDKLLEI